VKPRQINGGSDHGGMCEISVLVYQSSDREIRRCHRRLMGRRGTNGGQWERYLDHGW
jgi:hypothetical protein